MAGLGAIALRGWYLRAQDLSAVWELRDGLLTGPGGRRRWLGRHRTHPGRRRQHAL